ALRRHDHKRHCCPPAVETRLPTGRFELPEITGANVRVMVAGFTLIYQNVIKHFIAGTVNVKRLYKQSKNGN
ncbi:MAG: hypothetical protein K2Z76_28520, partial [Mycobacterium gordonae]|nr:hypothetical protein [Mycobacterium gordonae]